MLAHRAGAGARPRTKQAAAVARIPSRIAPGTSHSISTEISRKQAIAASTCGDVITPIRTGAPGTPSATIPASFMPMKTRKRPIPAAKLWRSPSGTESSSHWRMCATVSATNSTPLMNTAASAVCHV